MIFSCGDSWPLCQFCHVRWKLHPVQLNNSPHHCSHGCLLGFPHILFYTNWRSVSLFKSGKENTCLLQFIDKGRKTFQDDERARLPKASCCWKAWKAPGPRLPWVIFHVMGSSKWFMSLVIHMCFAFFLQISDSQIWCCDSMTSRKPCTIFPWSCAVTASYLTVTYL